MNDRRFSVSICEEWWLVHFTYRRHLILLQSRKLQESGWKPRWFQRDNENEPFLYAGGYWEAREQGDWDGCPDIFGEFAVDIDDTAKGS